MTFTQLLSILRARWRTAALTLFLVVATVVGASIVMPRTYTATAALLVDMKPNDPIAGLAAVNGLPSGYVATQADVIKSPRVAQKVVRDMKLAESIALRRQWQEQTNGQGSFDHWLAESLQNKLDVKPSRESSVISVSFSSQDPKFSAQMANAFVQGYLDTSLDLRVDPAKQYSSFFDSRSKELREGLEKAQAKLSAYQRDHGILANDERFDVENSRLAELSSQLVAQQALSADSSSRQAQAVKSPNQLGDVINNPVVSGLRADLTRQEAKLHEVGARLGDAHPQVLELKANINELRARLDAETKRVSSSIGINNSINQSREGEIRGTLNAQRTKVMQLKQQRDEAMMLARDVDSAQRAFDAVASRLTQSSLESQTKQTNTMLLNAATEPTRPSSPNIALNTVLALFMGAMFAIALALVRELTDRRLRGTLDVVQLLGIPVLGRMPRPERSLIGRKRFMLPNHITAKLPRAQAAAAIQGAKR